MSSAPAPTAVQLQILSDLHLEVERPASAEGQEFYHYDLPVAAPVLCLLGDVGCTVQEGLFAWLEAQVRKFDKVVFVPGNHEPYRTSIAESHARLQHFAQTHPSFIYLNRTRHDLSPNLTLLGCTLWSALDPDELDILSWSLQDLRRIDDLSPDAYNALHAGDLAWLNHTAAAMARDEPDRRIVVLTHHAPTQQGTSPPQFEGPGASVTKSAFSTELTGQPCWNPQVVKLWAFGHTHYSCDFERAGIRLYANQRGYKQGEGLYDPSGVVTV